MNSKKKIRVFTELAKLHSDSDSSIITFNNYKYHFKSNNIIKSLTSNIFNT